MVKRKRGMRAAGLNDKGYATGQSHHLSKLTDEDIALIHDLHELGLSYSAIAGKFDDGVSASKSHVRDIIKGRRRGQMPTKWRRCG